MRLGLITDIHEHVEQLEVALRRLESERVDQIVVIGDVFETGQRIETTCQLLTDVHAVGVWGNHDYGLCFQPSHSICMKYSRMVLEFMSSLKPRLELGNCLFTHVEPWLDPNNLFDLWYFDGVPDSPDKLARIFDNSSHSIMFGGHYHCWLHVTRQAITNWKGVEPICLKPERSFVVIDALCKGSFAMFDTETQILTPLTC